MDNGKYPGAMPAPLSQVYYIQPIIIIITWGAIRVKLIELYGNKAQ